jgi:hypothetical protein
MAVVVGVALIVFGVTLLWAIWTAHKGFWQKPRSDRRHDPQDRERRR